MVLVGEAYARGDVEGALEAVDEFLKRKGRKVWLAEALYLRAKIREKDLGREDAAMRDLRLLTVRHPGTPAAVFGQFRLARLYERRGDRPRAYREYVLCSRLKMEHDRFFSEFEGKPPCARDDIPLPRMTPDAAGVLVERAVLRAVRLADVVLDRGPSEDVELPQRTFIAPVAPRPIEIPADPAGRPASGARVTAWYVLAPPGRSIAGARVELVARVDPAAAGLQTEKRYSLVVETVFPDGPGEMVAVSGASARPQTITRELVFGSPSPALKLSLFRSGARVIRCRVSVSLAGSAPAAPPGDSRRPPRGFRPATAGREEGMAGASLARAADGRFLLVCHSPGRGGPREPDEDADLFLATSADGRTWTPASRLPVSSAVGDSDPSIAVLRDGRMLLAWTSERRAAGTSDVYLAESRDGESWTEPRMLALDPAKLQSLTARHHLTFHAPALHTDSAGWVRLFFVARGWKEGPSGSRRERVRLSGAGLYGVASTDGRKWSEPAAVISTPRTSLETFRPVPGWDTLDGEREVVSARARPSVAELSPGRILLAWVSTRGRVFLSERKRPGTYVTADAGVVGGDASGAATGAGVLGPAGWGPDARGRFRLVVVRRDLGPRVLRRERRSWVAEKLVEELPRFELAGPAVLPLGRGSGWLTAWTAGKASRPTGVYLLDMPAPAGE
jgi:hypothetical protein